MPDHADMPPLMTARQMNFFNPTEILDFAYMHRRINTHAGEGSEPLMGPWHYPDHRAADVGGLYGSAGAFASRTVDCLRAWRSFIVFLARLPVSSPISGALAII